MPVKLSTNLNVTTFDLFVNNSFPPYREENQHDEARATFSPNSLAIIPASLPTSTGDEGRFDHMSTELQSSHNLD